MVHSEAPRCVAQGLTSPFIGSGSSLRLLPLSLPLVMVPVVCEPASPTPSSSTLVLLAPRLMVVLLAVVTLARPARWLLVVLLAEALWARAALQGVESPLEWGPSSRRSSVVLWPQSRSADRWGGWVSSSGGSWRGRSSSSWWSS